MDLPLILSNHFNIIFRCCLIQVRFEDLVLTRLTGELEYQDREARLDLTASDGSRTVLRAEGTVPVDLALRPEGRRVVARPMDVRVSADSLRAWIEDLCRIGYGPEWADAVRGRPERLAAIRFTPTAAFQQTPGPGAGQRLAP